MGFKVSFGDGRIFIIGMNGIEFGGKECPTQRIVPESGGKT